MPQPHPTPSAPVLETTTTKAGSPGSPSQVQQAQGKKIAATSVVTSSEQRVVPSTVSFGAKDNMDLLGLGLMLLLALLFLYGLARARARRRQEIQGAREEPGPEALPDFAQRPGAAAGQDVPNKTLDDAAFSAAKVPLPTAAGQAQKSPQAQTPQEDPPSDPAQLRKWEKQQRRLAFLEAQNAAREAKQAQALATAELDHSRQAAAQALADEAAHEAERRQAKALQTSGSLVQSLTRSRGGLSAKLGKFLGRTLDPDTVEELEETLFAADIGIQTATALVEAVRSASKGGSLDAEGMRRALKEKMSAMLGADDALPFALADTPSPQVIMVVGVNGVGKTTTIGKLAGRLVSQGKQVVLAAGDTFRAAAVEQLEVWGERVGAEVVKGAQDSDPASVIFNAIEHAAANNAEIVIADTAGRLHTKAPLMEELQKIHRVMGKARAGAPDEVLLVVDATTGQNALQQAKLFSEVVPLTGVVLTKLDGTAKGGVVIGIRDQIGVPVRFIGTGEQVGDLRPFVATDFIAALLAPDDGVPGADALEPAP